MTAGAQNVQLFHLRELKTLFVEQLYATSTKNVEVVSLHNIKNLGFWPHSID